MQWIRVCEGCQRLELRFYPRMRPAHHLLASIATLGIWLPMWFFLAWLYRTRGECEICGRERLTL